MTHVRAPLLVILVGLTVIVGGGAAIASCAGPPPGTTPAPLPTFTGRLIGKVGAGTAGTLFEFVVESVERGDIPDRATVDIDVDEVIHGPKGDIVGLSSNSIGPPPIAGERYRVEAYRGGVGGPVDTDGRPRLFVNLCGGSLQLLEASPIARTSWRAPAIAAAALAALIGVMVTSTRRNRPARSG